MDEHHITIVTPLLLLAFVLTTLPLAIIGADIWNNGVRKWFWEGLRQPGLKWFGWYFPKGLKTLGPILWLLLAVLCCQLIHGFREKYREEPSRTAPQSGAAAK